MSRHLAREVADGRVRTHDIRLGSAIAVGAFPGNHYVWGFVESAYAALLGTQSWRGRTVTLDSTQRFRLRRSALLCVSNGVPKSRLKEGYAIIAAATLHLLLGLVGVVCCAGGVPNRRTPKTNAQDQRAKYSTDANAQDQRSKVQRRRPI